jgi:hypothetical protein
VTLCTVCTVNVETRSASFLVEPQNQGRQFVSGLTSKPRGRFVSGLTSKPLGRFSPVCPQNRWQRFLPVWPQNQWWVSWLSHKTKLVEGFPVWASKPATMVW